MTSKGEAWHLYIKIMYTERAGRKANHCGSSLSLCGREMLSTGVRCLTSLSCSCRQPAFSWKFAWRSNLPKSAAPALLGNASNASSATAHGLPGFAQVWAAPSAAPLKSCSAGPCLRETCCKPCMNQIMCLILTGASPAPSSCKRGTDRGILQIQAQLTACPLHRAQIHSFCMLKG